MRCQWQALLSVLPEWLREPVDKLGQETMQELRLRLGEPPELVLGTGSRWLTTPVASEDLRYCVNMATRYSPWTAESVTCGYITAAGGHRIGLCGQCAEHGGVLKSIQSVTSLCIRVARDLEGISGTAGALPGSILILGPPGVGKTTFLRDLIRSVSDTGDKSVVVLDERRELFPFLGDSPCFPRGRRTDVLSGCSKTQGLEMALRTMGPGVIAVDEIVSQAECTALTYAAWCGVRLLATVHAASREELCRKPLFRPLLDSGIFSTLITIHSDKTWQKEEQKL